MRFVIQNILRLNSRLIALNLMVHVFFFSGTAYAQCPLPSGNDASEGVLIYNSDHKVMQYCNGDDWIGLWGGGGSSGITQRVSGEVVAFDLIACPQGWSEYVPARGRFIRGIDNGAGNDPSGTRAPGNVQQDALQNIVGTFGGNNITPTGPFRDLGTNSTAWGSSGGGRRWELEFDASLAVRTADETRPKNVSLLYCRKD